MSVETHLQAIRIPDPETQDHCMPAECTVIHTVRAMREAVFPTSLSLVQICRDYSIHITKESDNFFSGDCLTHRTDPACGHIWGNITQLIDELKTGL